MLILVSIGGLFYYYQNIGVFPGGDIALSKIFWLGFIIFFWFFAPILLLFHGVENKVDQWLVALHLINVWLRAIIELFMMYQYDNWHPMYGIAHDIFSLFILLFIMMIFQEGLSRFINYFFIVITATFAIEAYFANYMLNNVVSQEGSVFFVPDSDEHQAILVMTWFVLMMLSIYFVFFVKKWYKTNHD